MGNYFDRFDNVPAAPRPAQAQGNYFDQFDQQPAAQENYFDQFDAPPAVAPKQNQANYFDQFDEQPLAQAPAPVMPAGYPTAPPPGYPSAVAPQLKAQTPIMDTRPIMPSAPMSAPAAPSKAFSLGAQVNQFFQGQPVVKDFNSAWSGGRMPEFAANAFAGLPAGPMELFDAFTNAGEFVGDQIMVNPLVNNKIMSQEQAKQLEHMIPFFKGSHMADGYKTLVNPSMSGAYGAGAFTGGALVPVGSVGTGGKLASQMLKSSALSGGASVIQDAGNQYRTTGTVNPAQTALSGLIGAGLGAGVPAVAAGIGKFFKKPAPIDPSMALQNNADQAMQSIQNLITPPAQQMPQGNNAAVSLMHALGIRPENLEPETANALMALVGGKAAPVIQKTNPAIQSLQALGREAQIPGAPKKPISYPRPEPAPPAVKPPTIQDMRDQIAQHMGAATDQANLDQLTEEAARYVSKNVKSDIIKNELKAHILATREARKRTLFTDVAGVDPVAQKLDEIAKSTEPEQTAQAIEDWAKQAIGADDAGAVMAGKTVGEFRRAIEPDFFGRNKNKLAEELHGHPLLDSRKSRTIFQMLGRAKVAVDHAQAIEDDFKRGFLRAFVDENAIDYVAANGMKITRGIEQHHSKETMALVNKLRDDMTDGAAPVKRASIASTITQKFDNNPDGARFARVAMPDNIIAAENKLAELAKKTRELEKAYGRLKLSGEDGALKLKATAEKAVETAEKQKENAVAALREKLNSPKTQQKAKNLAADKVEAAQKKLDAANDKLAEAEKTLQQAQEIENHLAHLEDIQIKAKKDPTAMIHIKGSVPHPVEGQPPLEVGIEFKKGAMERTMSNENREMFKKLEAEILDADKNRTKRFTWSVTAPKATLGALVGALVELPAHAANTIPAHITSAWDKIPTTEFVGGLIALHTLAPKAAKAVLTEERFNLGMLWKDTMDNMSYLEKTGVIPAGLCREIWNHQAQVLKSQKGVSLDDTTRTACMLALREGIDPLNKQPVTAMNCLNRTAGTVFENLTPEQASALTIVKVAQENLAKQLKPAREAVETWMTNNPTAPNKGTVKSAASAFDFMLSKITPQGVPTNEIDAFMSKAKSNFMDSAFFQNAEFSGTNLGDLFISGGAYAGPMNVARANNLVTFDREFRQLLKDSNFAGGFSIDRSEAEALANGLKPKKKLPWEVDFKSDLFNANRLAVASLLQHAQINKDLLKATGFNGSDVDFAREILRGGQNIDAVIGADAYIRVAKSLSEVLGMDSLRVNTDVLSRSKFASSAAVFFKQPARMSRLAMNYMANGEFSKMYTLLGAMALTGGSAAIPTELQAAGQIINPDSYFKAAAVFDQIDAYNKVTGERLTPKQQWSIFWVSMAGQNPVWSNVSGAGKEFTSAYYENKPEKFWKGAVKLLPILKPRVFGLSTRNMTAAVKYGKEAMEGKQNLYATNLDGMTLNQKATKTVKLDDIKKHPLVHFLSQYIPGKSSAEYANAMATREADARKGMIPRMVPGVTGQVRPEQQYYPPSGVFQQQDPASWFLRGGR